MWVSGCVKSWLCVPSRASLPTLLPAGALADHTCSVSEPIVFPATKHRTSCRFHNHYVAPRCRHAIDKLNVPADEITMHCMVEAMARAGRWAEGIKWVPAHAACSLWAIHTSPLQRTGVVKLQGTCVAFRRNLTRADSQA